MPKTTVTVTGEKPQADWYSTYSGVGALELARKNKMIEACRLKAAEGLRVGNARDGMAASWFRGASIQTGLSDGFDYEQTGLYSQAMSPQVSTTATKSRGSRLNVRERLLAAADELFYKEGVHTVGIDRIIDRAGVAKASLYSAFGSKEELVVAYLNGRA